MLYELIYSSVATHTISSEDIAEILRTARDFNTKNNITGCLLYHNNEFIQILEGEKKIVKDLYDRINRDKRHFNSLLLAEGEKDERTFNNWSMAFHELSSIDVKDISERLSINNFMAFSDAAKTSTFPMMLFWKFAKALLDNKSL